ncbi:MAG: LysR substrate-binding domain-containing protein [Rhodospirillales bacterium]
MRISYLKTFLTVAETGSFITTAEILNRTPSAVSLQMKTVEQALGTDLFDRTKRPPVLNQRGRSILGLVQEVVLQYDKLTSATASREISGEFAIGAMPTTLTGILPKALVACQRRYPNLVIHVIDNHSGELVARLHEGKIGAAITSAPPENERTIKWRPIAREPFVVIAPADTKATQDTQVLEDYPYIRFNSRAWTGKIIAENLKKRGLKVNMTMELDNLEAVATMVYNGLGVSIIPKHCVASPFPLPLKQLPFGDPPVTRTIGLAELTDSPLAHIIQGFYEELIAVSLGQRS